MICPLQKNEGAELVLDYCAGRLDPSSALAFERHIGGCAECRQIVEGQRAVWNALDEFEALEVSADFDRRLWARIASEDRKGLWQRLKDGPALGWSSILEWKPALAVAACCAAMAVGLYINQDYTNGGVHESGKSTVADKSMDRPVDVEQVESAVDDLDMLRQLGVLDGDRPGAI